MEASSMHRRTIRLRGAFLADQVWAPQILTLYLRRTDERFWDGYADTTLPPALREAAEAGEALDFISDDGRHVRFRGTALDAVPGWTRLQTMRPVELRDVDEVLVAAEAAPIRRRAG